MEENQAIKKGFNDGYLIEKHKAELSQQLVNGFKDKEHPYVAGFIAGSKQMEQERAIRLMERFNSLKDFSKADEGKSMDKDKGMEIDI